MNKLLITRKNNRIISCLLQDQELIEVSCGEARSENPRLGDIYVARVNRINSNISAAFLGIGTGEDCYYSLDENTLPIFTRKPSKKALAVGDELLVQIEKEAQKNKLYTVTSNLTKKGKYAIISTAKHGVGISKKISGPIRDYLANEVAKISLENFGVIIRTNAGQDEASAQAAIKEICRLSDEFERELNSYRHQTLYRRVKEENSDEINFILNCYDSSYEEVLTDDAEIYRNIWEYFGGSIDYKEVIKNPKKKEEHSATSPILKKLSYYDDTYSLWKLYGLEGKLKKALSEKVWLKSGGFLVIQPTEALTVIDVNTGKSIFKGNKKEHQQKINKEAAHEIAKQLRLRNLSGIIMIDFIDVAESEEELLTYMTELVKKDPVPTSVIDLTKLHLMEITRKKSKRPLSEQFANFPWEEI